jgi:protein-disulfide isomerase
VKSSEKKIFSCILVVAVILVGLAVTPAIYQSILEGRRSQPQPTKWTRAQLMPPGTPIRGDEKAKTTIVVFSDFQCPSCANGAPVLKKIIEDKKGEVNEAFHHFQVKPDHKFSPILSMAAEAAGQQGKFWEMHDILFEKQKDLVASSGNDQLVMQLRHHANQLGLDMMKFDLDMKKMVGKKRFEEDNKLGERVYISSTPNYFIIKPDGSVTKYESTPALQKWAEGKEEKKP